MLSSSSSTATTTAPSTYKGKITNRSWQQLPPEIVRLIATHYLLDVSRASYCPITWETRELWPSRMVYTALRDALEVQKLMQLCPSWHIALETHLFWKQACSVVDSLDALAHIVHYNTTSSALLRMTPFRHFRQIMASSCTICRINTPYTNNGLTMGKRELAVPLLGVIRTCKDHRKTAFCGLCLREAPLCGEMVTSEAAMVACTDNEDTFTWPNVAATCRSCRGEWLWRRMSTTVADREAVGGGPPHWSALDWETRQSIDAFVETGEGLLNDVISTARERWWLRRFTRIADFMEQAVAANRLDMRTSGYDSDGTRATDDARSLDDAASVDIDGEDYDALAMAEDSHSVRELAISGWARDRILDGCWVSPADEWYHNRPGEYTSTHPAPWSLDGDQGEEVHPTPMIAKQPPAPTFQLAENLYHSFGRTMKELLLPAMQNIVRQVVMQETGDPVMRVARMEIDDVLHILRQSWPWCKELRHERVHVNLRPSRKEREDDSSSSSKSDESHATSPVLSTTTLQTTPSPPPTGNKEKDDASANSPVADHVSPIGSTDDIIPLEPSNMLHPIPYVPSTIATLPSYSQEAFRAVWREACSPLYACRCKICERAMLNAGGSRPVQNVVPVPTQAAPPPAPPRSPVRPTEVHLQEAEYQEEEEEEEEEVDEQEQEEEEEEEDLMMQAIEYSKFLPGVTPRKRSSEDLDDEDVVEDRDKSSDDCETEESTTVDSSKDAPRDRTPPKRARTTGVFSPLTVSEADGGRLKKRPSEERSLLLGDSEEGDRKRARVDVRSVEEEVVSPPASSDVTGTTPGADSSEAEEDRGRLTRSVSGAVAVGATE
ncbi:hypothetical protein EVG20_g8185 [Dentipellis fragilis]|uniref:Uncharacterized protein n=1 Tax=Dentipellis fragilis TaxID=205917 RepID=A0A4Y9Y9B9_9AGAM|nr:hypothetical protein EVG20_g8185 [Dentipellis fragilis]